MGYNSLNNLDSNGQNSLFSALQGVLSRLKQVSINKAIRYLQDIPDKCKMSYTSIENRNTRNSHPRKYHPIKPKRGEIYNAFITEGVGSELCGNHPVVILQNAKANIYGEKVNVLPIEGNGTKINPHFHVQLTPNELSNGQLTKNPSRIIITDIMTLDKARLGRKIGCVTPQCLDSIKTLLQRQLGL